MTSIAVFAYNEARNIRRALDSIISATSNGEDPEIHVLINGCTDNTASIVQEYANHHSAVIPVLIPLGDKCNAWNLYVHELADEKSDVHFFLDGDCWCSPGSLTAMRDALLADPKATAIAGLPQAGRNKKILQRYVKERRWIFGNLYAIKWSRINWFRQRGIRLPIGLFGNDHVITRLLWLDEQDLSRQHREQVVFREGFGPCWRPLNPFSWRDCLIYYRRLVTYRLRHLQVQRLGENPARILEPTMDAINREILAEQDHRYIWDPIERAVRRRLHRMYPNENSTYYEQRIADSGPPIIGMPLKT